MASISATRPVTRHQHQRCPDLGPVREQQLAKCQDADPRHRGSAGGATTGAGRGAEQLEAAPEARGCCRRRQTRRLWGTEWAPAAQCTALLGPPVRRGAEARGDAVAVGVVRPTRLARDPW
jgi:hypothetical protein